MLDFMRKKKESLVIKIVFVVIVLSFIGTMFLVWGKGSDGAGGRSGFAAKVNGVKISMEEYQSTYQRVRNIYQQMYGQSLSPEIEKMLDLKKVALDNLIDNVLIMKEAKSMKITVSPDEVAKAIDTMPSFQKDGKFSFDLYQQLLRSSRITPKDFEESEQKELLLAKTRQAIKEKVKVSDEDALAAYHKENDKVDIEFVSYLPTDTTLLAKIQLSDTELNDYLQKNQNEFKTAEKVSISYVLVEPASQVGKLTVTEDEIQAFYQKNIDRWQRKDGIAPLKSVEAEVKAEALRQKTAKQAFEKVADTLYKNIKSGDLHLIAKQLGVKVHETVLFEANAPVTELVTEGAVVKQAFLLKPNEIGTPVETAKGIYLLKLKDRKPSVVPQLKEIRGVVEEKAKAVKAVELAKKQAEDATKQFANKGVLKTNSTGLFSFSTKGDVPSIGNSPELMDGAFKLTKAAPASSTVFKVGNRWYAIRLTQRLEASKDAFENSKEQIKQKLLPKKQEEAVTAWLKGLREKAKIELNPALKTDK